ncbi:zinc ribbon domain-containing protein [Nocardioides daejeonensis]|uniref:zinc ribbon domain-containing protein n=1 Tax=Nocardioides daejeonensis TaxID=1046556 RepID=UPI000D74593E|nr:zinc ribbon domain-containing protein [Nocardioides daejeonensis]
MPDRPGISAYAAYLPLHLLNDTRLGPGPSLGGRRCRSVANHDEDALTMAVEVAGLLGESTESAPRLLVASTSAPYTARTAATLVHEALGLSAAVSAVDLAGHRAGFTALDLAVESSSLAVASDTRLTRPGAPDELGQGDAAVAFLGGTAAAAELLGRGSRTLELLDRWRLPGEVVDRTWDERFTADVLVEAAGDAVRSTLEAAGVESADIVVVSSTNPRAGAALRRALGSDGSDAALEAVVGFTGAAHPGLLLADALDRAEPGQTILLVSAADGADAWLLRVGDGVRTARRGRSVAELVARRQPVAYADHLRWKGLLDVQGPARPASAPPAAPPMHRRRGWKYRLEAVRCADCSTVTTPPGKACAGCGSTAGGKPELLHASEATVVSVTQDLLTTMPVPSVAVVVADFDGGGRLSGYATDVAADDVAVGARMRPTFRRMWTTEGIHNYFWKLRPVEGSDVE